MRVWHPHRDLFSSLWSQRKWSAVLSILGSSPIQRNAWLHIPSQHASLFLGHTE
ncbi:Uncharacterised protein [Vibrio cholerae]|nr:Uncharacterised protein [Vibrio cholerae]